MCVSVFQKQGLLFARLIRCTNSTQVQLFQSPHYLKNQNEALSNFLNNVNKAKKPYEVNKVKGCFATK